MKPRITNKPVPNQCLAFTNTPYELELIKQYGVTNEELKEIRNLSKGLYLTLGKAIELHQSGELLPLKNERDKTLNFLNSEAEKCKEVSLSRVDSADDVSRILRNYFEEGDSVGLRSFLQQSKCKGDQIDRLCADWEDGEVNLGIIRMRAGNMLRHSLRRVLR